MESAKPIRILYVEDYDLDRELVKAALAGEGGDFELINAASKEEFEAHLDGSAFDLVMTDFNIFGFEGLEVLNTLRAKHPGLPVIIVTGTGSEEVAAESIKQGAVDYVIKTPEHIRRLPHTLRTAMEKVRIEAEKRDTIYENERKYRTLYDQSADCILLINDEGIILEGNPQTVSVFGYSPVEIIGLPAIDLVDPENLKRVPFRLPRLISGEQIRLERTIIKKDGAKAYVDLSARRIEKDLIQIIYRDITDRKRAESEKKNLEEKLRQARKMESIGNLAGGIAHDFNNILSSIIGFTEISLDDVEKGSSMEDNLQEIYTAAMRAKDLVKHIMEFARQSPEKRKPVHFSAILVEALKFIRSSTPASIEIRQYIESDSLVMGNATQIHQVIMNLCVNSAHAMVDDGGVLEVGLKDVDVGAPMSIQHPAMTPGGYVRLTVSDTGVGIPAEVLEHIFDPYFTTKSPGEGTGMGLAVAYGIIESYGGKIFAQSTPGEKTVFTVYLPILKRHHEHVDIQAEVLTGGMEKILFLDDEEPLSRIGRLLLEGLGYTAINFSGSMDALKAFRQAPDDFDLVITDMTMPTMNGDELALEMRAIRPDIPIILCSGYNKKISIEHIKEIGVNGFIAKPIQKSDLAKKVRRVLDQVKPL